MYYPHSFKLFGLLVLM